MKIITRVLSELRKNKKISNAALCKFWMCS
ncbi:hypothetical protein RDI58_000758 [Solanum bulbocastanum]|uniref:Uncharacterized protein n=1 Tax=Solanum bulbocastanum TaxID=147425 RepID=A0AAN8U3V6_SOLBU